MKLKKNIMLTTLSICLLSLIGCGKTKSIEVKDDIIEEIVDNYAEVKKENIEDKKEKIILEETKDEINEDVYSKTKVEKEILKESLSFGKIHFTISSLSRSYKTEEGYLTMDLYEKDILIKDYDEYKEMLEELKLYTTFASEEDLDYLMSYIDKYNEEYFNNNALYLFATNDSFIFLDFKNEVIEYDENKNEYSYTFNYEYDDSSFINGFIQNFFLIEMDKNIVDNLEKIKIDFSGNF